jgi:hypothetical protein
MTCPRLCPLLRHRRLAPGASVGSEDALGQQRTLSIRPRRTGVQPAARTDERPTISMMDRGRDRAGAVVSAGSRDDLYAAARAVRPMPASQPAPARAAMWSGASSSGKGAISPIAMRLLRSRDSSSEIEPAIDRLVQMHEAQGACELLSVGSAADPSARDWTGAAVDHKAATDVYLQATSSRQHRDWAWRDGAARPSRWCPARPPGSSETSATVQGRRRVRIAGVRANRVRTPYLRQARSRWRWSLTASCAPRGRALVDPF